MGRISDTAFGGDLFAGRQLRDCGIEQVSGNAGRWMRDALELIRRLPAGWVCTGEDIKFMASWEIEPPHHPNAWGALIRTAVKRGLLLPTGQWKQSRGAASRARQVQEYRRAGEHR